jgi:general secretion pathway protein E
VRKLCIYCRQKEGIYWREEGCDKCSQTGYHGRVGIYELMLTTDQIRRQIHDRAGEAEIRATAQRDGMALMREDGERWLINGTTSQSELLRVTKE